MYLFNSFVTNSAVGKTNIGVIHPTYYDPYILKRSKKPIVLTCHDLIHEKFGDQFSQLSDTALTHKKPLLAAAAAIIAVSENTKQDIVETYGIPEARIEVIHLASAISTADVLSTANMSLPEKYLLYVGNRGIYKNFINYVKAVAPLLVEDRDLKIICAGGGTFTREEVALLKQLGVERNIIHYQIDDAILATLYHYALGFVFPSLYEGFGIPVLEAFSCGCPVLASNTSSIPEVAAKAASFFDPLSKDSMLESTRMFIQDSNLRKELRKAGQKRVEGFSWAQTAEKTLNLYKKIV